VTSGRERSILDVVRVTCGRQLERKVAIKQSPTAKLRLKQELLKRDRWGT
jgi:hypothetical protein